MFKKIKNRGRNNAGEFITSPLKGLGLRPNDFCSLAQAFKAQCSSYTCAPQGHRHRGAHTEASNTFRELLLRWVIHGPQEVQDNVLLEEAFHNKHLESRA